jgi:hypothetical protein
MDGVPWVIAIATMYTVQWLTLETLILTAVSSMPEPRDADNAVIVLSSQRNRDAAAELENETEHDTILWLLGTVSYMTHLAVLTIFPLDCSRFGEDKLTAIKSEDTWEYKFMCMRDHTPRPHPIIASIFYFNIVGLLLCKIQNMIVPILPNPLPRKAIVASLLSLAFTPILGVVFWYSHLVQFASTVCAGILFGWFFLGLQFQNPIDIQPTVLSKVFLFHDLAEAMIIFFKCLNAAGTGRRRWAEWFP